MEFEVKQLSLILNFVIPVLIVILTFLLLQALKNIRFRHSHYQMDKNVATFMGITDSKCEKIREEFKKEIEGLRYRVRELEKNK